MLDKCCTAMGTRHVRPGVPDSRTRSDLVALSFAPTSSARSLSQASSMPALTLSAFSRARWRNPADERGTGRRARQVGRTPTRHPQGSRAVRRRSLSMLLSDSDRFPATGSSRSTSTRSSPASSPPRSARPPALAPPPAAPSSPPSSPAPTPRARSPPSSTTSSRCATSFRPFPLSARASRTATRSSSCRSRRSCRTIGWSKSGR